MSQFAEGGLLATKPYISGSNYLKKMTVFCGFIKKLLLVMLFAVFVYLMSALVLSVTSVKPEPVDCQKMHTIYLSSNGIHLDLIIPTRLLSGNLLEALSPPEWASYLAFGWGDKEFYINTPGWKDLKLSVAFRALFTNSQSAVHVVWIRSQYPGWESIPLCESQFKKIAIYLDDTFQRDDQGRLQEIYAAGYTEYDQFYLAHGSFNCIRTCNQWVNQALKKAGVRTSVWSPFDKGVLYQVRGRGVRDEGNGE